MMSLGITSSRCTRYQHSRSLARKLRRRYSCQKRIRGDPIWDSTEDNPVPSQGGWLGERTDARCEEVATQLLRAQRSLGGARGISADTQCAQRDDCHEPA